MAGPILQPKSVTEWGQKDDARQQTLAERVDSLLCANMNDIHIYQQEAQLAVVFAMDDDSRLVVSVRGDEVTIVTMVMASTEGAH